MIKNVKICDESNIKIHGRTIPCLYPVSLIWTGSSIEMNIKCSELSVLIGSDYQDFESWIAVEVDGEIIQRRPLNKDKEWISILRMTDPTIERNIKIIKETQAMSCDVAHCVNVYEIKYDGEILPVNDKNIKIEYIGDSITSGEGCIGAQNEMEWISMFFSHVGSYPYLLSKKLNADYRVISQSGWGVYCSWDNKTECAVPLYYEDICSLLPNGDLKNKGFNDKNDFDAWQPDAIVINLGVNDDVAFHGNSYTDPVTGSVVQLRMDGDNYNTEDINKVRNAIYGFLKNVRSHNKKAKIYWAFGILGNDFAFAIKDTIDSYNIKENDSVKFVELKNTEKEEFGSRLHPGKEAHLNAVNILYNALVSDNLIK